MSVTKKKTATKKAPAKKKAAAKTVKNTAKKASKKVTKKAAPKAKPAVTADELKDLDRKGLAARARQLKTELLAVRFNVASPSLKDYRSKRKALASVLSALR